MGLLSNVSNIIAPSPRSGDNDDDTTQVEASLQTLGIETNLCEPEECAACPKYPPSVKIEPGVLWGSTDTWDAHVIIPTDTDDWIRDVTEIDGSVAQAIEKDSAKLHAATGLEKIKVSTCNLPLNPDGTADLIVLPQYKIIKNVKPSEAVSLIIQALNSDKQPNEPTKDSRIIDDKSKGYILLCSHKTRDKRCGITAPIMKKQFDACLRHHDLYRDPDDDTPGGVKVVFINHVGGHKFAANVFVYTHKQAIWMARCTPVHCKAIVENTVLENKVVFPQLLRQAVKW